MYSVGGGMKARHDTSRHTNPGDLTGVEKDTHAPFIQEKTKKNKGQSKI